MFHIHVHGPRFMSMFMGPRVSQQYSSRYFPDNVYAAAPCVLEHV
jgi:hypothetical protein